MKVKILNGTSIYPLQEIGESAGICWKSDITDKEKNIKRAKNCIKSGHGRVLEYPTIKFYIYDVSARVIREWYTHIGGSPTRLQESTRYVDEKNFNYVTPPSIQKNDEALNTYDNFMNLDKQTYTHLNDLGIPKEDSAMVLPLGMYTGLVDKRNPRNLIDMAENRMCNRAYWEFRDIMKEIFNQLSNLSDEWKWICENCIKPKCEKLGYCPESKGCGKYPKKDELVWGLKKEDILKLADTLEHIQYNCGDNTTFEKFNLIVNDLEKLGEGHK